MMIARAIRILRTRGIAGLVYAINSRLQGLMAGRAKSFQTCEKFFADKCGIEVGGPSHVFTDRGNFPVYSIAGSLDNCNFSAATVWEGSIQEGKTFKFDPNRPAGFQHIAEATAMERFVPASYNFVLASHVLEHIANPIQALSEWKRLLKDWGVLVLLLPHKDKTFDHRRPVTTMEHLIADFDAGMREDDMTHLPEILALHDLERDPEAGDAEDFKMRSLRNFQNRCLHHHVFDPRLAERLIEHVGLEIRAIEEIQPHHILLVAQLTSKPPVN
ncbi:MAG: class I SAM-dependent methyltransferase [Rhodocyclaceae bacterium]|nr:class I SAM-dependent methyltransferase [Rhodocyclaceae bacterium]